MSRPKRSAALRALELIRQGYGVKEIDAIGAPGLTPEEEDELNDEISGESARELYEINLLKGSSDDSPDVATGNDVQFSSYDDRDVRPPVRKFRPSNQPGLHLVDRLKRSDVNKFTRAIDFFELFMPDEILEMVVDNTDLYAWVNIHDKPSYARKRDGAWESTCLQEIKQLIALIIFHGFAGRADTERNWSQATLYSGGWSRRFLSRNRFKALSAMLHCSKPGEEDPSDILAKVRPLLDHMREVCKKYFQPNQSVSIDERMVRSKGRTPIKQYMPNKPTKFGYKLWCLCDSVTGYTFDFSIYVGRNEERSSHGLGHDVVTSLMRPYMQQGYMVFCDNFFSSLPLAQHLLDSGTLMCGTMQPWRRGFPEVLKEKSWMKTAKRGDMQYIREKDVLVLQWFDKRVVNMISTIHRGDSNVLVIRNGKTKKGDYQRDVIRIPRCVHSYNKSMGGVDLADQMIESYNCLTKVTRWWKTLFFHFIDIAVLNSYILFKMWREEHPDVPGLKRCARFSHLHFREELVRQLARISSDEGPPIYLPALKRKKSLNLSGPHDPEHTAVRRNCQVCYILRGKQVKSHVRCSDPQCQVHLCLNLKRNCFPKWHSPQFDCYRYKSKSED